VSQEEDVVDTRIRELLGQAYADRERITRDDLAAFARGAGLEDEWVRRFRALPDEELTHDEALEGLAGGDEGFTPLRNKA
jgi:hypothetical protein